jgi:hypothetical protein
MSGYEVKQNPSLHLMSGRLGFRLPKDLELPYVEKDKILFSLEDKDGISCQAHRLKLNGGTFQQHRMIFDKRRSLDRALLYSYQACDIKLFFL